MGQPIIFAVFLRCLGTVQRFKIDKMLLKVAVAHSCFSKKGVLDVVFDELSDGANGFLLRPRG